VKEKADLFISIHHNATGVGGNPREARHTVTYASNDAGLALAKAIQRQIGQSLAPVKDNGAKIKSLAVCRNPAVPSCLVEVDFINLPEGEEASLDPARRKRVSRAIVIGILDWLAE
jgi:N-acetylmuramoyl-L-alanine amidase